MEGANEDDKYLQRRREYLERRRLSTSQAQFLDLLDTEVNYMVKPGYSDQQRFIDLRPISFHYCLQYMPARDQITLHLALNYHDRFLSRNIEIPVVINDGGFERNLQLFVFTCVLIACRQIYQQNFNSRHFVDAHQVANVNDIETMEFLIFQGLDGMIVTPHTVFNALGPLISLLEIEEPLESLILYFVYQTLYTIEEDIKFTEFRPSVLAASVFLVASYRINPDLFHPFRKKIFGSDYFNESKLNECFDELKDHVMVDYVFNREKSPLPLKPDVIREFGKNLVMDEPLMTPYEYMPNPDHPLEFILEAHENFVDAFRAERQNQEENLEVEEDEDDEVDDGIGNLVEDLEQLHL